MRAVLTLEPGDYQYPQSPVMITAVREGLSGRNLEGERGWGHSGEWVPGSVPGPGGFLQHSQNPDMVGRNSLCALADRPQVTFYFDHHSGEIYPSPTRSSSLYKSPLFRMGSV